MGYELIDLLEIMSDEGVIKAHSNGKNARTFGKRINWGGKKVQFLDIKKEIFEGILEGTWELE